MSRARPRRKPRLLDARATRTLRAGACLLAGASLVLSGPAPARAEVRVRAADAASGGCLTSTDYIATYAQTADKRLDLERVGGLGADLRNLVKRQLAREHHTLRAEIRPEVCRLIVEDAGLGRDVQRHLWGVFLRQPDHAHIRHDQRVRTRILQQLKDRQRSGKQTGLLFGRRLDAHALYRDDGKVFYKNALPNDAPQIAVGLLLDESGSMSSGDRAAYARASAIILYDFCQALRIPVMVYGHSTKGSKVELYSYGEFDAIDQNDKYRLVDISARGSNRDGAALRYVAERLSRRPEELRLLMLVSDGQPAAPGYYGTAAEEDLRGIQQEYRRKGVLFLAAAIGDDKENIQRIYGDAFLDISDLHQLPVKLAQAVKRFLRV